MLKIEVSPLRERKQDLHELLPFFTKMLCAELGMPMPKWAYEDISSMQDYDWPGNIRELKNLIERCLLLGKPPAHYWRELNGLSIHVESEVTMSPSVGAKTSSCDNVTQSGLGYPNDWPLRAVEKAHIQQIVALYEGNKSAAARDLGVARKTLERKYKEWENEDLSHEN